MSEITVQGLLTDAGIIRGEIHDSQNSHDRVGKMFEDIIKYIQAHEGSWATGGGGGDGTSSITGTLLLNGLNGKDNPSLDDQILHWSSTNGWGYIPTPTGGTGTGGGVTWQQLRANTSEQIDASHLSDALSNYVAKVNMAGTNAVYEWWGNKFPATPSNGVYKINGAIEFSNGVRIAPEEGNHTLKIEAWDNSSNPAHIYTTGGVSALGNSSSGGGGGGGGEGTPLNNLLGHINSNDYYGTTGTVSPSTGDTIIYNGTKWKIGSIDLEDLLGTAPAQFVADKILAKDSGDNYKWIDASGIGGSTSISNLWKVGDVGTDSGYTNTPIADGHILQYGNSKWNNVAFGITGSNNTLSSITLGSNTYSLPQANGNAMGIVKAGTGLSASSGTMSVNTGFSESDKNYAVKVYSGTGTNAGKLYVTVPWTDTTYEGGDGITVSSILSSNNKYPISAVAAPGGGLSVDNTGIKINPNTNKRVLWGNQDTLVKDIGKSGDNKSLYYVQDISMYGTIAMNTKNSQIQMADPAGTTRNVLNLTDKNQTDIYYGSTLKAFLDVGYGCARVTTGDNKSALRLWGNDILFKANGSDNNNRNTMILTKEGSTYLPLATTGPKSGNTYTGAGPAAGLRIGDAVLYWDEANQALALAKYNASTPNSPTTANFYATGGVSALGMSPGTSSVDAMTFGDVDITSSLKIKLGNTNNKATIYTNTGTGLIIDNPYGGIFINDSATYINDTSGDTYFGGDENTNGGKIYICLASQGYEYYRLDVDKLQRDGYLTLD